MMTLHGGCLVDKMEASEGRPVVGNVAECVNFDAVIVVIISKRCNYSL